MGYQSKIEESKLKETSYTFNGKTHCAIFVQGVTGLPSTTGWKKGKKVMDCSTGEIPRLTAIATFDSDGKYPTVDCPKSMKDYNGAACGRHAAVYISHSEKGIEVYDQWDGSGGVNPRTIRAHQDPLLKRSNDASYYHVIELE